MENSPTIKSEINIQVSLDENHIPESISWNATDAGPENHAAKALLLSLWDVKSENGVSIHLWTKQMTIPEMNVFIYQSLLSLSDSLLNSTQNKEQSEALKQFAQQFFKTISAENPS
jgi:gliding motility-associated protein GldC